MSSCQRCKGTSSGPQAFLLTCRGCSKTWHHRCHMPPVEDQVLIDLIRATTGGDKDNDLNTWTCRRCKKAASTTPSAISSREPTASSESHEDKNLTLSHGPPIRDTTSRTSVTRIADVRAKQESNTTVDVRHVNDRERNENDRQEPSERNPVEPPVIGQRIKSAAANQPHVQLQPDPKQPRDAGVQMADAIPTKVIPQEKKGPPQILSVQTYLRTKAARKLVNTISETSTEDDVEMNVDSPAFPDSASRPSQATSLDDQEIRPKSVAASLPHPYTASSTDEREQESKHAKRVAIQPQVDQVAANELDDDPDDLYGPPIERRIIRILPSLAEELREQQRRVAAEKEKRRAPLAPDWIFARHVNDPQWKETPKAGGRKRRKPSASKLEDNGINVDELMDYFMVQNWVRENKT